MDRKKKLYWEGDMPPHVAEARHRAYALPEVENPTLRLPGSRVALHGDEPLARTPAFSRLPSALALSSSPQFPSRNGYSRGPAPRSHARATRTGPDTRERFPIRARDRDLTRLRAQIHLAPFAPSQARLRKAIGRSHLRGRSQDPTRQGFGAGTTGGHLR